MEVQLDDEEMMMEITTDQYLLFTKESKCYVLYFPPAFETGFIIRMKSE